MSLALEIAVDLQGEPERLVAFKFSCAYFELNVFVPYDQLDQLDNVSTHPWEAGSIRAGTSAGESVFWSAGDPGQIAIMVGHDDETWDFCVSVPSDAFAIALSDARGLLRASAAPASRLP